MIGDQRYTEALECDRIRLVILVGERCLAVESASVRSVGEQTSENADMSSDKPGASPGRRKPKVSWARFVLPGLVGT